MKLKIEHYSKKGHGVAPIEGSSSVAEVIGAVRGDVVQVELLKKRKKAFQTKLLSLDEPSPDRIEARCSHAGICGGCSWQQMEYQAQLKEKMKLLTSLFDLEPLPIIPCVEPWHYRNKMEYSFSESLDGEKFLGLMQAGRKGRVLNLEECHLSPSWFIDVLKAVFEWFKKSPLHAYHQYKDLGTLRTLTLRSGNMVILTISGNPSYFPSAKELQLFKKSVRDVLPDASLYLRIQKIAKGSPTEFFEMHLGGSEHVEERLHVKGRELRFKLSPDSFFQPNSRQAEKLFTRALEIAQPQKSDLVYDLYCGTGTLGMIFAPYVQKVIGVELSHYAVCDAEVNLKLNEIENVTILQGDVGSVLSKQEVRPDLVLLDPPRPGLTPKALEHLLRLSPKKILYISCNPRTQKENILVLSEGGYQLQLLQGVDQFPHTVHLETIALLEKR